MKPVKENPYLTQGPMLSNTIIQFSETIGKWYTIVPSWKLT